MLKSVKVLSSITKLIGTSVLVALAAASPVTAQQAASRIAGRIDEMSVVTLEGNVHPMAQAAFDRGAADVETRMGRMVLVLSPSAAQQAELDKLTAAQHDSSSPMYHQWISPAEYGARFGVSDADLAKVTGWLQSHGFAVEPAGAGRQTVVFSGTAAQVADTFHTEIHSYAVAGRMHLANAQDPQIPEALASVVSGVLTMHNFGRNAQISSIKAVAHTEVAAQASHPENTQGTAHYLFPADYATIYNINPLYQAGTNGTGASIAIVGRSNINLNDVAGFRSTTGLAANAPKVIVDGTNPGLVAGDQDEATLDVEWAGAVARNATVNFVVAASTNSTDGVDLSAQYIVNHKTATVMSTSYGSCEANMGSSENAFYNNLWQQAAAEGISSFVSSGDSGAAGCNSGSDTKGSGAGVNGLCSSPYSTCVGGTEFNEGSNVYWASTNGTGNGSALGYIPEKVWNESASDGGSGLWAGGGGISKIYTQPSWQVAVEGSNSNGMRAVPDVALTAASHDGYLIEENGSWFIIAGTSAASPSFAGMMTLVNQVRGAQGNANATLYSLVKASTNPFHATMSGNNSVPGVNGYTATGAAYNLATGLGSVNAATLVSVWPAAGTSAVAAGTFTLKASAASVALLPGKTGTFTIAASAVGNFTSAITLKVAAPAGVSVALSSTTVKPGASVTATVTVAATAAASTGAITITGTSGSLTATTAVAMTVQPKATLTVGLSTSSISVAQNQSGSLVVTVTTGGSYAGAVSLSVSGVPAGVSAGLSRASYTPAADGAVTSTLTLAPSTTAAVASSSLTVVATGDGLTASAPLTLKVTAAPAIAMALSTKTLTMASTGTSSVTVTVNPVGGVSLASSAAAASFTVTGLPTGVTASWTKPVLTTAGALQTTLKLTGSTTAASNSAPLVAATVKAGAASYSATVQTALSVTRSLSTTHM